jgi:hypothetical protein
MAERVEPDRSVVAEKETFMEFTVQHRNLLDGDETRRERRERPRGFGDASNAPDWAKVRIIQVRSAVVEGRAVPAPSRAFIACCEQRSRARTAQRTRSLDADLRRRLNEQAEAIRADAALTEGAQA